MAARERWSVEHGGNCLHILFSHKIHIHSKFDVAVATGRILDHTPSYKFYEAILTKILGFFGRRMKIYTMTEAANGAADMINVR